MKCSPLVALVAACLCDEDKRVRQIADAGFEEHPSATIGATALTISAMLRNRRRGGVTDGTLSLAISGSPCYVDCPCDGHAPGLN